MSSKIFDKEFLINLFIICNSFLHKGMKIGKSKKQINKKLSDLSKTLKLSKEDTEYCFIYLKHNNIIFENMDYFFVNLNLLKKLLKEEKDITGKRSFIILQSNYELLVKPECSLNSFFFLIQFSEIKNKDVVYKFFITENSLHNAFLIGVTQVQIKNFLLKNSSIESIPHNVEYLIDDIHKRMGEIKLGYSRGYIIAKNHILKHLMSDDTIQDNIVKTISSTTGLLRSNINLWDLYFSLKEKKFFPNIDTEKVESINNDFQVLLNEKEMESLLTMFYTMKEVGFEHHIKVDFNLLNNLVNHLENKLNERIISKAVEKTIRYKQELKNSIKSYVLKSLKASVNIPKNLVLNQITDHYTGENPATIKKDIIKMIDFSSKHKLKFLIAYHSFTKKSELIIEPKYLYNKKVLYYYNSETKEEENIEIKKIIFTALL